MDESTSKEKILKKIRKALLQPGEPPPGQIDLESDVFLPEIGENIEVFAGNFTTNNGHFRYCFNEYDFLDQFLEEAEQQGWKQAVCIEKQIQQLFGTCDYPLSTTMEGVHKADVGITGCDALIARTGSVVVNSQTNFSRTVNIFPPAHVVVVFKGQVLYDLKNYFEQINRNTLPSMMSIISGPSRTADIEKTLVLGAHGPKQIFVYFIDQELNP